MKYLFLSLIALPLLAMSIHTIELEVQSLLDDRISIKMPKGFEIMSEEMLKTKYPTEQRPTLVYTNPSGDINLAINLTPHTNNQDLIESYHEHFVQNFEQLYSSAEWKDKAVKEINGRKVGYMKFITPAVDAQIYNVIFFTDLDNKLLLCNFNCTKEHLAEWQAVGDEIMNSLQIK